jgi:acetyltransferase
MLALGKKLGFDIKREPDSGDNELVIHFGGNRPFQDTPIL